MNYYPRPAGQLATATTTPTASLAAPPSSAIVPAPPPASAAISVGDNGRIAGIDGMLDQIAAAAMRQARTEILPTLQQDRELQRTVGAAAGRELAKPLWALAGVAAVFVGWNLWRSASPRAVHENPRRTRARRRR